MKLIMRVRGTETYSNLWLAADREEASKALESCYDAYEAAASSLSGETYGVKVYATGASLPSVQLLETREKDGGIRLKGGLVYIEEWGNAILMPEEDIEKHFIPIIDPYDLEVMATSSGPRLAVAIYGYENDSGETESFPHEEDTTMEAIIAEVEND